MASVPVKKLSHKIYRKLLKKLRRKRLRQKVAAEREKLCPSETELDAEEPEEPQLSSRVFTVPSKDSPPKWIEDDFDRRIHHQLWLDREEAAQKEFLWKQTLRERLKAEREAQEKRIRLEWEEQQRLNKENEEEKTAAVQKRKDREVKWLMSGHIVSRMLCKLLQAALLNDITSKLDETPTHNPEAPVNFGTERDRQNCPFFLKTGACRFGDRCSRFHLHPNVSCTILIPGMYHHFGISESFRDEYDTDISLEYEEGETYRHFKDFYDDVVPEFKRAGDIIQFKTCCNHEPHLRGNVYIQYKHEEAAVKAYKLFNGRWYAGKQLSCSFTNITKWKSAICGLFSQQRCPKGKNCNFLHVFRNPHSEFCEADHDYQSSPWINRFTPYSSRSTHTTRSSRSHYSSHRSNNHHGREQEKRNYSSRSNAASPYNNRSRSRSRTRSRTRSRSRSPHRSRNSSRRRSSAAKPHSTNRSRSRSKSRSRTRSRSRSSTRSRSISPRSGGLKGHRKKSSKRRRSKKNKRQSHKKKNKSRRASHSSNSTGDSD